MKKPRIVLVAEGLWILLGILLVTGQVHVLILHVLGGGAGFLSGYHLRSYNHCKKGGSNGRYN